MVGEWFDSRRIAPHWALSKCIEAPEWNVVSIHSDYRQNTQRPNLSGGWACLPRNAGRWFHGIRKKSHEIVSRTRLNSFYFSIHFACFFKTNKTLEVTLKQNFVSSSDEEATAEALYRELDKPKLFLDTSAWGGYSKWHWQNTLSVRASLPRNAGRWWRGDSHGIVSRTRQRRLTSRYNFLSKITRSDRARTRKSQHINL